jgi:UDP-N-acetylglucosamine/UDP-N-acetylgalactosamine diphosphorylase
VVDKQTLESRLSPFGQTHLLAHWDRLDAAGKGRLAEQLLELDLNLLARLRAGGDNQPDWSALAAVAEPPPAIRLPASAAAPTGASP